MKTVSMILVLGYLTAVADGQSFQTYAEEQLVQSGFVDRAAFLGIGGGVWGSSYHFRFREGELEKIVDLYKNPAEVFTSGITLDGVHYDATKADSRSIYGRNGEPGIVIVKTLKTVIVGTYEKPKVYATDPDSDYLHEDEEPEEYVKTAEELIENFANYLIQNGY